MAAKDSYHKTSNPLTTTLFLSQGPISPALCGSILAPLRSFLSSLRGPFHQTWIAGEGGRSVALLSYRHRASDTGILDSRNIGEGKGGREQGYVCMCVCVWERERERERERESERERVRERVRESERVREREKVREWEREKEIERERDSEIERERTNRERTNIERMKYEERISKTFMWNQKRSRLH